MPFACNVAFWQLPIIFLGFPLFTPWQRIKRQCRPKRICCSLLSTHLLNSFSIIAACSLILGFSLLVFLSESKLVFASESDLSADSKWFLFLSLDCSRGFLNSFEQKTWLVLGSELNWQVLIDGKFIWAIKNKSPRVFLDFDWNWVRGIICDIKNVFNNLRDR